jgi:hypothetical protein
MKKTKFYLMLLILTGMIFILAACDLDKLKNQSPALPPVDDSEPAPSEDDLFPTAPADPEDEPIEESDDGLLPPVAVIRAREMLAEREAIPVDQIEIISFLRAEWSDSCLGLGGPAESCLAAITPGWRVELKIEIKQFVARTDEFGEAIRFEGPVALIPVSPVPVDPGESAGSSAPEAAMYAREALAEKLGISLAQVEIVSYESKTWPDGCLGLPRAGEMCTMALVSGWRVELSAGGRSYIARTNETGSQIRFESAL